MWDLKSIMTTKVVKVSPDTPIIEAANTLVKFGFNGLPVVSADNKLLGIITEYDFILKKSSLHLLTIIKIFEQLDVYKKDLGYMNELKDLFKIQAKDIMNPEPITLLENASIEEGINTFSEHHRVNPIPIVSATGELVGILSRHDILKFIGRGKDETYRGLSVEKQAQEFVNNIDQSFLLVSRSRTKFWLIASILFTIVGFSIAWFLILRVNIY